MAIMKNNIKYLGLLALGLIACEPEFDNPIEDGSFYTNGEADLSKYVALGNSITAGLADSALYIDGQENSYPNLLSKQFALAGGGAFTQPLMSDNVGGFAGPLNASFRPRLVLAFDTEGNPGPAPYTGAPSTTDASNVLTGPFNNMGVPGAKSFHLLAEGYGVANPYFGRFASSPNQTVLADAVSQGATFFTIWLGNNDVLGYAASGGVGEDHNETGNLDPATYGSNDITNNNVFAASYSAVVDAMTGNGAKGVLLNLPDVSSLPFFTTVPNNALVLTAEQAAGLTGFFQAYTGLFTQGLILQGVPAAQAQALASQYAIQFNEGPNRFLISVPASDANPQGFRQMTEEELLVLTINQTALATEGYGSVALSNDVLQVLGLLQAGGAPTQEQAALVLAAVNPINDGDALDASELAAISSANAAYNTTIAGIAAQKGLGVYDVSSVLAQAANGGIPFDGGVVTSEFVTGGGFSLDGVHPSPRAHAIAVNGIIDVMARTYGAKLPKINPADFGTITLSNEVN